jgi:type IV secretory pathway TrbD component
MPKTPRVQPVYVSLNAPLTIGGAERRLFFLALALGAATFTFFGSLLAGLVMFLTLYLAARWTTRTDPQLLRIVLRSAGARARYDPAKLDPILVSRSPRR